MIPLCQFDCMDNTLPSIDKNIACHEIFDLIVPFFDMDDVLVNLT